VDGLSDNPGFAFCGFWHWISVVAFHKKTKNAPTGREMVALIIGICELIS
jgi:hypothetical protein